MKYDVFISYSRKDTKIANRIYGALTRAGVSCFIDREDIRGGRDFTDVIMEAIDNAKLFLFIGSKNSYSARYAPLEARYAFDEQKTIVPYLIDNTPLPKKFCFYFGAINILNIKEHPIETTLVEDVLDLLGKESSVDIEKKKGKATKFLGKVISVTKKYVLRLVKEKHPVVILLYILQFAVIIAMLTISLKLFLHGYIPTPWEDFMHRRWTWWWNLLLASALVGMLFATLQMFRDRKKAFYAFCILDIVAGILIIFISWRINTWANGHPKTYGAGAETLYANLKYVGYVVKAHGLKPIEVLEMIVCYMLIPIHILTTWAGLQIKKNGKSAWSLMSQGASSKVMRKKPLLTNQN